MSFLHSAGVELSSFQSQPSVLIYSPASIHSLSTEILSSIVNETKSSDLHNLNLTCKTFHCLIQGLRWKHVRMVGRQKPVSTMIRHFMRLAVDPKSLVDVTRITYVSSCCVSLCPLLIRTLCQVCNDHCTSRTTGH